MGGPPPGRAISFRHLFAAEIEQFLRAEDLGFESAAAAIVEVVVALARYREEGTPLFPEVFLCDDVATALRRLGGAEAFVLGRATLDGDGVRRALKRAAPLSSGGWSVLLHVDGATNDLAYGLVRIDPFVLYPSAMDHLRALPPSAGTRLLGIAQLAENVIEIRASRDVHRHVYLSGARVDGELGPIAVERFVAGLGEALAEDVREALHTFWRRVLRDAIRSSHGALVAIARSADEARARFVDASHLAPPVDVAGHVRAYLERHDEATRAAVQGLGALASGMLRADGITVLGPDGAALAYNAFIAHRAGAASTGGARRRTYETLTADVELGHLAGAFYHSQDGGTASLTGG